MNDERNAYKAYQRAFNKVMYGTEEPSPAEVGRSFDQRYGLWLPAQQVKRLRARVT